MKKGVDSVFYSRVVVEDIAVKITEFRGVLLQGGVSKRCGNIGFYKGSSFESDQALKTLDK